MCMIKQLSVDIRIDIGSVLSCSSGTIVLLLLCSSFSIVRVLVL